MDKTDSLKHLVALAKRAGALSAKLDDCADNNRQDLNVVGIQTDLTTTETQMSLLITKIAEWGEPLLNRKMPCQALLKSTGQRVVVHSLGRIEDMWVCGYLPFGSNDPLGMRIAPESYIVPYDELT